MDGNDRRAIEDLFEKLSDVERNAPPRDHDAEAFIRSAIDRSPAAPYYMAQTIIVQQQALEAARQRIEELEQGRGRENEGFLSGLFGGRSRQPAERDTRRLDERQQNGPWSRGYGQGGGFLAGAAQTAMGVAGGILIGNMIAGVFGGGSADAAENDRHDRSDDDRSDNDRSDDNDDGGSDFADAGGDFGGGD